MSNETKNRCVVAAVDFSVQSTDAARWAVRWFAQDADLILVHALTVPHLSGMLADRYPVPESLIANAKTGADKRLRALSDSLGMSGTRLEVREGRPADVIAQVARENEVELVVVGKHGTGGLLLGYPGRTADELVRSSTAPVLVVSAVPAQKPRRIIVPLTFSSITPLIIQRAAAISQATGAELIAVHVVGSEVLSHVLSMSAVRGDKPEMSNSESAEVFREETDEWKKQLVEAGVPASLVSSQVVFGEVGTSIVKAAKDSDADMIIMGSHAGPARRFLLGSAASAVLRNSDMPVLIVVEPELG